MTAEEWKDRYIAQLVKTGWPSDAALADFNAGYQNPDGSLNVDTDEDPEDAANDECSYGNEK